MTRSLNVAKAGLAIVLAVALSACATRMGRDFDAEYAQQIKPGATTKSEIRQKLGQPPIVSINGDEETWTYAYYKGRGVGMGIIDAMGFTDAAGQGQGAQKRLNVTFQGETVKESDFKVELPIKHEY